MLKNIFMKKILLFLCLILSLNLIFAEGHYDKEVVNNCEISYDKSENLFIYPLEHSVDRIVHLKNISNKTINLNFDIYILVNEKKQEVQFWPQPAPAYLLPGDERDIVLKIEWFPEIIESWEEGKNYDLPFYIKITIGNSKKEITLKNKVFVEKFERNLKDIKTNSLITGTVYDFETNKPITNAEVVVWSNGPRVEYKVFTDDLGNYSVPVRAYQRSFLKNYIQYSIKIKAPSYEEYNYAISPKENDKITNEIKLIKETKKANYVLKNKIFTSLPPARVDFTSDHKYFVTVPFHSSEKSDFITQNAYLHYFSSDGNLLWKYKLDNEIPTVDISDDGKLVLTAHRPAGDNWNGGDYLILLDDTGKLVWEYRIDGIGDWSLPNYHPNPGEVGDGFSEVRMSHNKKYIAAGTWNGKLYFLDLKNKKVLWQKDLNDGQVRYILFKEDDSSVYVGSDPYMFNYDLNGNLNWKGFIGSWPYNIVLSNNYIFVGPKLGRFLSLFNKNTGDVIWRYPIDARPDNLLISPDETYLVYQSSNGELAICNAFFNIDGELLFNLRMANGGYITSDSEYIAYYGGEYVYLVNRRGHELWRSQLDKIKWPAPRGSVYISDDKTKIIVINAMTGYVYFFEGGIEDIYQPIIENTAESIKRPVDPNQTIENTAESIKRPVDSNQTIAQQPKIPKPKGLWQNLKDLFLSLFK